MIDKVINRRDLITSRHRIAAVGVTLFFWGALLYLWQPLIAAVAWVFEVKLFYDQMIVLGGLQAFRQLLLIYLAVIVGLGATLLVWARINQWRFRGKERRSRFPDATVQEVADTFGVDPGQLYGWQQQPTLTVSFDDAGNITGVAPIPRDPSAEPHKPVG